jgi:hypothetical protein
MFPLEVKIVLLIDAFQIIVSLLEMLICLEPKRFLLFITRNNYLILIILQIIASYLLFVFVGLLSLF